MRLRRVEITGFKSIKSKITLYVGNTLTIVVGANDHGKTNLLEAIELLNGVKTIEADDVNWDSEESTEPVIEWHFSIEEEAVEIKKLEDKPTPQEELTDEKSKIETPSVPEVPAAPSTEKTAPLVKEDPFCKVNESGMVVFSLKGVGGKLTVVSAPFAIRESKWPELIKMKPEVELIKSPGDQLPDSVTLAELKGDGQEFMKGIFMASGLWEKKEEAFTYNAPKTTKLLEKASEKLTKYLQNTWKQGKDLKMVFDVQDDKVFLLIVDPAVSSQNPRPSTRSSGFKSFFYLQMITRARSEGNSRSRIFLFDEPGTYLHPLAQFDLQRGFEKISRKNQIVYTTHTPFLVSKNFPERNRVVSKTTEGTLIDAKPFLGNWKSVSKSLGVVFGQYQNSPFSDYVLMTEGPSDYYYILSAIRILNAANLVDIDINGLSCFDGGDSQAYISKVRSMVELEGKTVVCMVDGDEGGDDIKDGLEKLKNSFSSDVEKNRIIIYPLPQGCSTEDIFSDEDKLRQAVLGVTQEISMFSPKAKLKSDLGKSLEELVKEIKPGKGKDKITLGRTIEKVTSGWTESGNSISKVNIALKYLEITLPSQDGEDLEQVETEEWHKGNTLPKESIAILKDLIKHLKLRGRAEVEEGAIEEVKE